MIDWEMVGAFALFAFGLLIMVASLTFGLLQLTRIECSNRAEVMGLEHEFRYLGGCFVQHQDQWMLLEEYMNWQIAREGLEADNG